MGSENSTQNSTTKATNLKACSSENTQSLSNHMAQYNKKTYLNVNPSLFDPTVSKTQTPLITRTQFPLQNNLLLKLENFLNDAQSNFLVDSIESLSFNSIAWEYPADYRSCKRKIVFSDELALFMWQRLVNCFEWEDLQFISPFGFDKESRWLAHKINPCFRFTKYQKGDFFDKHLDGGHVQNEDDRSVLTLMIYLNDQFTGGDTVFYEDRVECKIKPQKNLAVVFNHDILHEGAIIEDGFKYILRTDVMFKRYRINPAYVNKLRVPTVTVKKQLETLAKERVKSAEEIEEEHQLSEKLFYESVDWQRQGNPRLSTEKYLEAQRILSQYPTYLKKKLQKNLDENFPKNKNFNKFATPFYLETVFKFLFDFDLLKDSGKTKAEPQNVDSYTLEKDTWLSSKILNKDKLEEILKLRCVSRKMNKFVSGNFLWKKFLQKNFTKNLLAFRDLETPNDNHYLEIFKFKSFEFKKNVKVFIDIGSDFIRLAFNQPVIKKEYKFYNEYLPFNAYNGKVENLVNKYRGHLWGSRSGFNFIIGKFNRQNFSYGWDCGSTYENGSINYKRILNILSYFASVNNSIEFSFSLPFLLFSDFDFEYSEEKYVELIKYEEENLREYKEVLIEKDPNSGQSEYYRNLPERYLSYGLNSNWFDYQIQNKKTNTKEFKKEIRDENDFRKKLNERLTSFEDLPNELLAKEINFRTSIISDYLQNCISREKLFFKCLDKSSGIVVFFDGCKSTFAYFRENQIVRNCCFSFEEKEIESKKDAVLNEFVKKIDLIHSEIYNEDEKNKDKSTLVHIDALIVYEKDTNEKFVDEVKEKIKDKLKVETVYYQYDEILNLAREIML